MNYVLPYAVGNVHPGFMGWGILNRSRSRWLKAIRSVSMGPSATHETGHFYFAQTGHSHFAATLVGDRLTRWEPITKMPQRFGLPIPRACGSSLR